MEVRPGDAFSASVHVLWRAGTSRVTVTLRDDTTGHSFHRTLDTHVSQGALGSAEWIVEAPWPSYLTDFGHVGFTDAVTTESGPAGTHTGPIDDPDWLYQPDFISNAYSAVYSPTDSSYAHPGPLNDSSKGSSFAISSGPAGPLLLGGDEPFQLAFTHQPGRSAAGQAFPRQPQIAIENQVGNVVRTDDTQVTLSLYDYAVGTTLTCGGTGPEGDTFTAVDGVVSATGCSVNEANPSPDASARCTEVANCYRLVAQDPEDGFLGTSDQYAASEPFAIRASP
jgi:hypothetical protein